MAPAFLWPLLLATLGFSLLFGGVVLARMRALLAEAQAEARLRRKAMAATGMA
jgi:heme exporter protein C